MRRRHSLVAAAGIASFLVVALGSAAGSTEELRIEAIDARQFPELTIIVTPPPHLLGIEPNHAFVIENGVSRPTTVRLLTDEPLEVLLALDTSGSMRGPPLDAAKGAAAAFVASMPPTTRFAVMGFSTTPEIMSGFSDDPAAALAAIDALQAAGETALYDAVISARGSFPEEGSARRFIVLLSDGGDTISTAGLEEASSSLRDAELGLYAIELQTTESDPESLESLTATTAGRVVRAEDTAALAAVYDLIASELVNQLAVTYTTLTGGPVDLTVSISDPAGSASGSATITLPAAAAPTTTTAAAPTTTAVAPTGSSPEGPEMIVVGVAKTSIAGGPGLLGGGWALPLGAAGVFLAVLIVLAMAAVPAEGQVAPIVSGARRFRPSGGTLSRLAGVIQRFVDAILMRTGRLSALTARLDSAGIRLAAGEYLILVGVAGLVGFAVGLALFGFIGAGVMAVVALVTPRLILAHRREARRTGFGDQLESTLQLLAGSLRAGYGLMQAISTVASEAPSPTKEEFGRVMVETRVGRDLGESLAALALRMENADFGWITQAIDIQRTVGGDLAEILDTVAQTIRERNQIRRQIRALSAEGRFSSYILIALPFVVTTFLLLVTPDFLRPLVDTTPGRIALATAVVLLAAGVVWIRRLVRIVF